MDKYHNVESIKFAAGKLLLDVDGRHFEFQLESVSDLLAKASQEQLEAFEVSPSGYGIHWPLLDEDISIDGLLGITHHPSQSQRSA